MTTAEIIEATPQLAQELETYYAHKQELLQTAEGKYVVIKGDKIIGLFDDAASAYNQAVQQLGLTPFLVRQIREGERMVYAGGAGPDYR